jgi:hypothetical protein
VADHVSGAGENRKFGAPGKQIGHWFHASAMALTGRQRVEKTRIPGPTQVAKNDDMRHRNPSSKKLQH